MIKRTMRVPTDSKLPASWSFLRQEKGSTVASRICFFRAPEVLHAEFNLI